MSKKKDATINKAIGILRERAKTHDDPVIRDRCGRMAVTMETQALVGSPVYDGLNYGLARRIVDADTKEKRAALFESIKHITVDDAEEVEP